ncbi:HAD family hydrolase [Larsenimonas rhizosphaerae]|uniref:HAD family hydrolase n=1 Tax=Larsenimonas rhizosphaerae TaxID=2944682 RepID=UPI0020347064|nr:HAD family hydrolase [Larsenimonas rhizosphaerae]MCM2131499.1 HAD family hydrolase [Larsenimonas rhizosphaerae]
MLKAITFDLDDTLWDNGPVMARTEQVHYDWLDQQAHHAERFPLSEYVARREAMAQRYPLRRGDFTFLRHEALLSILQDHGLPDHDARRLVAETIDYMLTLRHEVTLYDESLPLLETLAENYRLGAITNGNVDVRRVVDATLFDVVINAGEIHAPKPDARAFLAALARMRATAGESLHVGDSWKEDALPALRLGMNVAWIDRRGSGSPIEHPRLHRLAHVRELPYVIEALTQ